jgi:hypothetical protein
VKPCVRRSDQVRRGCTVDVGNWGGYVGEEGCTDVDVVS